ncbi:MAG: SDR family NAD(P)-dependent oxidoreductase [Sandaracinaceae bacterium]|nr:SDR family NAD(P)-dependent oxidoreductase [Sandaracinaceae bacterium]
MRRASGAWIVTGAASGIGRELARRLHARGETLALWDRDEAGLVAIGRELGAHTAVVDVREEASVASALDRARAAVGPIAHVGHCAGVLAVGNATEVAASDYRRMMEVNYLGTVHVALAVLSELRAREGRASLMLVASVAGLRGFPRLAGYSASKFAVVGFAQALSDELAGTNVRVKVLCPPPVDTPMVRNVGPLPPVYKLSPLFTAEQVVGAALVELERPGLVALVDLRSKLLWRAYRAAPALVDRVVRAAR